jgi:hypothetical protein
VVLPAPLVRRPPSACPDACGRVGPAAHSLTRVDPPGPSPNRTGPFPGIRLSRTRGLLSFRRPRGERRSMPAGPGPATLFAHSSLVPFAMRWAFPTAIGYYGTSAPTGPLHPQQGQSNDRTGGFPRSCPTPVASRGRPYLCPGYLAAAHSPLAVAPPSAWRPLVRFW